MDRTQTMILYVKPGCPYCNKVLGFLQTINLNIQVKNDNKDRIRKRMAEELGVVQFPVLCIEQTMILESEDIIKVLQRLDKQTH